MSHGMLMDVFVPAASTTLAHLREFLTHQVVDFGPDIVIVVERKGTAVYRAVLETSPETLPTWDRVISSSAIHAMPLSELEGKRILVFDDMYRAGNEIRRILNSLVSLGLADESLENVRVAAFGTHEDAGYGHQFGVSVVPHAVFHRHLSTDAYRSIRSQIVTALQVSGSLMLDTEHIEIRVEQKAPLSQIAEALSRSGAVVAFESGPGRTNLTVYYGNTNQDPKLDSYPPGTRFHDVVRKVRLVERGPGEFALIPIFLPDVHTDWGSWKAQGEDRQMYASASGADARPEDLFQLVALQASLEPLALAVRDLYAAREPVVGFELPTISSHGRGPRGYDLAHLHVVYPTVDLEAVLARVIRHFSEAKANGSRLARKRWKPGTFVAPRPDILRDAACHLLQRIGAECDTRAAERLSGGVLTGTKGLQFGEVMAEGVVAGLPPHYVSACMDLMIDEAMLITRVESVTEGGRTFVLRTYLPDGEVASEQIRDFTRRSGFLPVPGLP